MPVVLILVSVGIHFLLADNTAQANAVKINSIFSANRDLNAGASSVSERVFLASPYAIDGFPALTHGVNAFDALIINGSVAGSGNPSGANLISRNSILKYKIQKGDTLPSVAANFKISVETILRANSGLTAKTLKLGKEIAILPVSGVLHQVADGETLESIAGLYGSAKYQILDFNRKLANRELSVGDQIIVPEGN